MKNIKTLVTIAVALFVLAGCGKEESVGKKAANSLAAFKNKIEIVIGTEGTYAPFTFMENGKLTGFDIEIAKEVFKRVGVKPKFVTAKWDGLIAGLDTKRWDVVANQVGIRPDRQEKYSFSDPYIASKSVIITKADNNDIKSFQDLKGKRVASSATSNYHDIAVSNGAKITVINGFDQAIELINTGRVDATLNDSVTFYELQKKRPDLRMKIAYSEENASESGLLFRKGNTKLIAKVNKALADMKADGTYTTISKRWFGTDVSK